MFHDLAMLTTRLFGSITRNSSSEGRVLIRSHGKYRFRCLAWPEQTGDRGTEHSRKINLINIYLSSEKLNLVHFFLVGTTKRNRENSISIKGPESVTTTIPRMPRKIVSDRSLPVIHRPHKAGPVHLRCTPSTEKERWDKINKQKQKSLMSISLSRTERTKTSP